ncbi:MAG: ribonuclease III [Planctomycetota bacterium]
MVDFNDLRDDAERLLGHTFDDAELLEEALTHSSAADDRLASNERMEFLGDAVLDLVVCELLYRKFPENQEGELTKMKSAIVSRRTCAAVARETKLADLLIVGKGITGRSEIPASLAAAVYESVVAALYLDGGFEPARRYIVDTITPHVDLIVDSMHAHNYKALLQQHVQKEYTGTPVYELLDEQGPDHSKCFEMCVNIGGRRYEGAWGPNKKTAEQKAAVNALESLGVLKSRAAGKAREVLDSLAPTEI